MNRTNLINHIIEKQKYTSYLEIGVGTGRNFAAIECKLKHSVDPDKTTKALIYCTSDEFFDKCIFRYDCIFIDGLHHADQVRKDIVNAWKYLSGGGCLIIHDTNPHSEEITHVPRDSKEWCGDVYKAVYQVNNDKFTLRDDHGVTVIRKMDGLQINDGVTNWEEFNNFRSEILNLKTWEQCIEIINSW